jgi:hypothetical protein
LRALAKKRSTLARAWPRWTASVFRLLTKLLKEPPQDWASTGDAQSVAIKTNAERRENMVRNSLITIRAA